MAILYGKIRINGDPGQTITITTGKGQTKTVQTTGTNYTDVILAGMEEYTITNGVNTATVLLNINDFATVDIPAVPVIYNTVKNATGNVTEAQWLEFINAGCISLARSANDTASFIGKNVTLSNSVVSNYTSWKIADFNHDSSGNTVDLIQNNTIYSTAFGSNQTYSSSTARSWLTGTYLPGFSTNVKNKLQTMTVVTGSGNVSDKIKLLSCDEMGITSAHKYYSYSEREGSRYPIFNAGGTGDYQTNSSRIRTGTYTYWWLRSRYTSNTSSVWLVASTGGLGDNNYTSSYGLVPALRFA